MVESSSRLDSKPTGGLDAETDVTCTAGDASSEAVDRQSAILYAIVVRVALRSIGYN